LSKGGADDFRSWVSTNASPPPAVIASQNRQSPISHLSSQCSSPVRHFNLFFSLSMFTVERRSLKEKNLLQLASLNIFPGMNYVQVSTVERHTHPKIRRYLFFSFSF
jgi:hypothetical protein